MENDYEKFSGDDEVATVSSNTGLVKYGLVLMMNRTEMTVIWHPNGAEEIISYDKVVLMDRLLKLSDIVRKVSEGKRSQFGFCENIDIYATVKIVNTNKIIENINYRNFTPSKHLTIVSSVFYESWIGKVKMVKSKVTFVSQDGSIFTLENPSRRHFISLSTSDSFFMHESEFYHGQKLKMRLDSLESAKFLTISNLMKCLLYNYKKNFSYKFGSKWVKVYIQDITVSSVEVKWYCQVPSRTKPREEYWPEKLVTGDNLKKLKTIHLFGSSPIQVGQTHWYTIKDTDNLMTMKQWQSKCTEAFNIGSGTKNRPSTNVSAGLSQINERILNKKYKFKLLSKKCESKPSTSTTGNSCVHTLKSSRLKRNRMWKSLIKKRKQFNIPKVKTKPNSKVVVEICYTKTMVDVIWQDGTKETGLSSTDLYPVRNLDDLELFPGNFVTEKSPASDVYGVVESMDHRHTAHIQWFKVNPENPSLPNPIEKTFVSAYDLRGHPDFHFESGCLIIHVNPDTNPDLNILTAGKVLSTRPDGRILVMWVNGEKTECWPQELFVVKLNDDVFNFQDEEYEDEDDDVFNFKDEEYEDEDDDAPLAVEDHLSKDLMCITSSGSSNKNCDQVHNEQNYASLLVQLLEQSATCINLFLDAVKQNCDTDKVLKLKKALEQYRSGFNVSSCLPTSECKEKEKEIETWYKDLMDNISKLINKIISRIDIKEREERELVEEEELSYETLIKDSVTKLKQFVSDFINKVKLVSNELYLSKYGIIKNCDTKDESDNFSLEIMDVTEPASVLPVMEPHSTECHFSALDTELVYEVTKPEYNQSITKPKEAGVFDVVETLMDNSHKYINDKDNLNLWVPKVIAKDIQILQKSLPAGIWVKTFENRMDLFSLMIRGPEKTPYAGGLFLFDVKIPPTYPIQPPLCHYYSYCDDRLNPNLYEDGKVCLSLLGTCFGHGVELCSPNDSNLLQLLVSIQGLILVREPYYNVAGIDSQQGQKLAKENSRVYNEMALIKVVQSMTNMLNMNNSDVKNTGYFEEEILEHVKTHGPKLINTIENWIKMSEKELTEDEKLIPGYPLLPLSKGNATLINPGHWVQLH
eukprot:XP_016659975.1 PREDICTED: (E3-independent) E2 ubiquitin-conjugating enzyme UBE2O-like [Acyrthosiphon pisum]